MVKALKVILLVLVLILLFAGLTVVQAGIDVRTTVLEPDFYVTTLAGLHVFEIVPEMTMAYVSDFFDRMPPDMAAKAKEAWLEAATPEWLEAQFRVVVHDVVAFVEGRQESLTATIAVGELRDRFVESFSAKVDPYAAGMMAEAMANVPDSLALADQKFIPSEVPAPVARGIRLARVAPLAAGGVCILLVVLCFALAGGFPGGARWVATGALLSGLLTTGLSLVARHVLLPGILAGIQMGEVPSFLESLDVQAVIAGMAGRVLGAVRTTGLAFVALAVVLYVVAAVVAGARARRVTRSVGGGRAPSTPAQPQGTRPA